MGPNSPLYADGGGFELCLSNVLDGSLPLQQEEHDVHDFTKLFEMWTHLTKGHFFRFASVRLR